MKIGPYNITEKLSKSINRVNIDKKKSESNLYHIAKLIPAPAVEEDDYEDEEPGYDQGDIAFNENLIENFLPLMKEM